MTGPRETGQGPTPGDEGLAELLPWYVNGTLDDADRRRVEQWLEQDPLARVELAREERLSATFEARVAELPADVGLDRLMRRVESSMAATEPARRVVAAAARPGLMERLMGWLSMPGVSTAMAAAVVLQAGIIVTMLTTAPAKVDYRSVGAAPQPSVRVVFSANATEPAIRELLISKSAVFIAGPNQLGEYWIVARNANPEVLGAALKGNPLVELVTVDPDGPPKE